MTAGPLEPTCAAPSRAPPIEIVEEAHAFFVCLDAGSTAPEDIRLDVGPDFVAICIERPRSFPGPLPAWAAFVEFERAIRLPRAIVPEGVHASLYHGVLEIALPKRSPGGTGAYALPPA